MAHLPLAQPGEVLPREVDMPADDPRRGRQEADDRQAGRGLAAARFADDTERLALVQREADVVDRLDDSGAAEGDVMRLQIADLQQRRHSRGAPRHRLRSCGSRRMRSQSPNSWVASTIAVFSTFGRMCLTITRRLDAPAISASLTYSRSRRLNTSPRITRA